MSLVLLHQIPLRTHAPPSYFHLALDLLYSTKNSSRVKVVGADIQYLKMPDYTTREILLAQLDRAIKDGGQSFHLS
jgi:hypothetical protein